MRHRQPIRVAQSAIRVRLPHPSDPHRRMRPVLRTVQRGHDDADPAVADQAAVEQVQRFDDPARRLMVGDRDRRAHHRTRVERGVVAARDRDLGQLFAGRAVHRHVPAGHQRAVGRGAVHPPQVPGVAPSRRAAEPAAARARGVAEHTRNRRGLPCLDRGDRRLDERARRAPTHRHAAGDPRIEAKLLTEAQIVQRPFWRRGAREGE